MKKLTGLMFAAPIAAIALSVIACSPAAKAPEEAAPPPAAAAAAPAPSIEGIPAGDYKLDKSHGSLRFDVSHLGYSHYTAYFSDFDAALNLDPAHPEAAKVTATINPLSLVLNAPPKGFHDELMGKSWFDAKQFPKISFASTKVEKTGDNTAVITGDLTLHGITKPVTMNATFNGGYAGMKGMDPNARIGFSAKGTLKRADFGIAMGVPAPGSNMGVSDEVNFAIEAEFRGPPLAEK